MRNDEEFLQKQAVKRGWRKYYSCLCPVNIGTHPTNGMIDFINYDTRKEICGVKVWAALYYERELTDKELTDYNIIAG